MTLRLLEESGLADMIPKGARIGIKPNLVSPTPAEYGATTHPEVVEGIIRYLLDCGFSSDRITVMEGSWIGDRTEEAIEFCGYKGMLERYGVPFVDAQRDSHHTVRTGDMNLEICDVTKQVDFLINVPVLKGHGQTKITCALKNLKGLIPNSEKRHFHTLGLHEPIARLSGIIQQNFIVVDHICGDLEMEDGGNPIETNCIMTAIDPVLMDAYACHLLGFAVEEVPYIGMAEQLGTGCANLKDCEIAVFTEDGTESFMATEKDSFESPRKPSDTLLSISYVIEDADSCSACYASLAPVIMRLKEEGKYDRLLEKTGGKIAIGQGFSGKFGSYGVGRCCGGFEHSVMGCPPDEEEVYQKLCQWMEE